MVSNPMPLGWMELMVCVKNLEKVNYLGSRLSMPLQVGWDHDGPLGKDLILGQYLLNCLRQKKWKTTGELFVLSRT